MKIEINREGRCHSIKLDGLDVSRFVARAGIEFLPSQEARVVLMLAPGDLIVDSQLWMQTLDMLNANENQTPEQLVRLRENADC